MIDRVVGIYVLGSFVEDMKISLADSFRVICNNIVLWELRMIWYFTHTRAYYIRFGALGI